MYGQEFEIKFKKIKKVKLADPKLTKLPKEKNKNIKRKEKLKRDMLYELTIGKALRDIHL